jgi:hypothetical protein
LEGFLGFEPRLVKSNWEECGPCPVFASHTLASAVQLRKKYGKTSFRVEKTLVRVGKTSVRVDIKIDREYADVQNY